MHMQTKNLLWCSMDFELLQPIIKKEWCRVGMNWQRLSAVSSENVLCLQCTQSLIMLYNMSAANPLSRLTQTHCIALETDTCFDMYYSIPSMPFLDPDNTE